MQATTCFHDGIPNAILQETDGVLYDPIAFHPTNCMIAPHENGRDLQILRTCRGRECPATTFLVALENRDTRQKEALEALILIQTTASWQGIPGELRHALLRRVAFIGGAQEGHGTGLLDHQEVFERVMLLL